MRRTELVVNLGQVRNAYKYSVVEPEGGRLMGKLGLSGG
jgi:hypothetical protein